MIKSFIRFCLVLFLSTVNANNSDWIELFNGKDLSGWEIVGGSPKIFIERGMIVGEAVEGTPSAFICTKRKFDDFILEAEVKNISFNSGIQFRSQIYSTAYGKRVKGYQYEIDPWERNWTAGIYEQDIRNWLYPMEVNPAAQAKRDLKDWNTIRIECKGNVIRTFLNGVSAAYLVDDEGFKEGVIALQIHSVGKEDHGKRIYFRNIRIKIKKVKLTKGMFPPVIMNRSSSNKLEIFEKKQGWVSLFNGKNAKKWRGAHIKKFPKKGWRVEKGILSVEESGESKSSYDGDIITKKKYRAFELQLMFKLSKGADSGIKYFVTEEYNLKLNCPIGLEYQLIDNKNNPNIKKGRDGSRANISLYDLITSKKIHQWHLPPNGWNHARLIVYPDGRVEHWVNNILAVTYIKGSNEYLQLIKQSNYKNIDSFGLWESGHILLQNQGDFVQFKNIKIKELD